MFTYLLELANGTAADPPTLRTSTPTWAVGDEIFVRPGYKLRVIATRAAQDPGANGVLVVEAA